MHIQVEKPRLGIPAGLLVDDPAPCINPLYYFRLQVNRERYEQHEQHIPLDFLEQFIAVCQAHGIRGKFSILPYPAGLGSILDGWDGCDRYEMARWLDLARTAIAPSFDITPEILTHTLALDLQSHTLLPQSEHDWLAERTRAELVAYFGAALAILKQAGFAPTGITQPCYFKGSLADYNQAVLEAVRLASGPAVTFYFLDGHLEEPPFPPPDVVLLDRERGEAVVSILDYAHEYFWSTQRPDSRRAEWVADQFIAADGRSGRLVELAAHDSWLVFCCHWQSLYSDGSRQGLAALEEIAARLARIYGPRLIWLTIGEIARYQAASEGCQITVQPRSDGWEVALDAAFDCPDFTFTLQSADLAGNRVGQAVWQTSDGEGQALTHEPPGDGLLSPGAWRQAGDRVSLCFDLRRGLQVLRLRS